MTDRKNTKRALLTSVISMLLCVTMLIGSTFAWFTDNATTSVNTIQAGTLKLQLLDEAGNDLNGKTLQFTNKNGETDVLFEPGATFKTNAFKVHQNGNLEFKYMIEISGIDGDAKLLEVLEFCLVDEDGTAIDLTQEFHSTDFEGTWEITYDPETGRPITTQIAGLDSDLMYIQAHMKEDAGNEYQGLALEGISINVRATQDTVEYDSFGDQYDANAIYEKDNSGSAEGVVTCDDELVEAIEAGTDYIVNGTTFSKVVVADGVTVEIKTAQLTNTGYSNVISVKNGGKVIIDSAEQVSDEGVATLAHITTNGQLVINGGSFGGTVGGNCAFTGDGTGTVIINGGTFNFIALNGVMESVSRAGSLTINGGTFIGLMSNPTSYVNAETHQVTYANGVYTVTEK